MARTVTSDWHSAESLLHFAKFFEDHAATLKAAAATMAADPPIESVEITHKTSREVGIEYLTNWVNAAKQAAFDARSSAINSGENSGVRKSDTPRPKR